MIRAVASADRLVQRLRVQAERLAAMRGAQKQRERAGKRADWHSARSLWPDFTDDDTRV